MRKPFSKNRRPKQKNKSSSYRQICEYSSERWGEGRSGPSSSTN